MSELCYVIGARKLRGLREHAKLTQKAAAEKTSELPKELKSGISRHRIKQLERRDSTVKHATLRALTLIFKCDASALVVGTFADYFEVPSLKSTKLERLLDRAIVCDLAHRPADSVRFCQDILKKIDREADTDLYAAVFVRYLTFLDHAGEHDRAVQESRAFLHWHSQSGRQPTSGLRWIRYQLGICERQAGVSATGKKAKNASFERAEAIFKDLRQFPENETAATHQLGVVFLERFRAGLASKQGLASAKRCFQQAARAWKKLNDHRESFALRRLGEIHVIRGQKRKAAECFLQALKGFAWHHSDRDASRATNDVLSLI